MAFFCPIFVFVEGDREQVEPVVAAALAELDITSGVAIRASEGPWIQITDLGDSEAIESDSLNIANKLSKALSTDAIALVIVSSVDSVDYRHYRKGDVLRVLAFGTGEPSMTEDGEFVYPPEGTWSVVKGTPQAWEEEAIWKGKYVQEDLKDGDSDVKQRFASRSIVVGQSFPMMFTDTPGEALGLPGFSNKPFAWEASL